MPKNISNLIGEVIEYFLYVLVPPKCLILLHNFLDKSLQRNIHIRRFKILFDKANCLWMCLCLLSIGVFLII